MILPIGFGKKLPSFPILTTAVSVAIAAISIAHFGVFKTFGPMQEVTLQKFNLAKLEFSKKNCAAQLQNPTLCNLTHEILASPKTFEMKKVLALGRQDQDKLGKWIIDLSDPGRARQYEVKDLIPAQMEYRQSAMELSAQQGLLTPMSKTVKATALSFVTHQGWAHLLGNLLVLFFFLRLLEPRYPRILTLLVFVAAGTLGLLVEVLVRKDELVAILGASAGVSGAVGLFWVTYFHHSVRSIFLNPMTWFTRQKLFIPVSWGVPLFVISLDLIGLFEKSNVAHGAHLYGFAIGAVLGLVCRMAFPLARDFLYENELEKMYQLKTDIELGLDDRLKLCESILDYNPNQFRALRIGIKSSTPQHQFFREHFDEYLVMSLKNNKVQDLTVTLADLKWDFDYRVVLASLGPETLLGLGKYGLELGEWHASLYFYSLYAERFASKKNSNQVQKTVLGILKHAMSDPTSLGKMQRWMATLQSPTLIAKIKAEFPILNSLGESA